MSFRAPFTTQFLYLNGRDAQLEEIEKEIRKYDLNAKWHGRDGVGYFCGVIKGLYPGETEKDAQQINSELKRLGIRIVLNHEDDFHPLRR